MLRDVERVINSQREHIGEEVVTDWVTLDQRAVDVFSSLTGDYALQHNDPSWAREVGRFGGRTIVHGLFGVSLVPHFLRQVPDSVVLPSDEVNILNYGIDSLRFVSPMFVGVPIRGRLTLVEVKEKAEGRYLLDYLVALEQEGSERPCMIAHSLLMVLLDGTGLDSSDKRST